VLLLGGRASIGICCLRRECGDERSGVVVRTSALDDPLFSPPRPRPPLAHHTTLEHTQTRPSHTHIHVGTEPCNPLHTSRLLRTHRKRADSLASPNNPSSHTNALVLPLSPSRAVHARGYTPPVCRGRARLPCGELSSGSRGRSAPRARVAFELGVRGQRRFEGARKGKERIHPRRASPWPPFLNP
jgi:hypothetical protein